MHITPAKCTKCVWTWKYALHFDNDNWVKTLRRLKENCSASKGYLNKNYTASKSSYLSYMLTFKNENGQEKPVEKFTT